MTRARSVAQVMACGIILLGMSVPLALKGDPPGDSAAAVRVPSDVAWTSETIKIASGGDAFRGMLLARRCGHCHGSEGFSAEPFVPNLAGIDRLSIWKQLQDFRSGKRISPVMQPVVAPLSSTDIADLSAYFSMLPTFADPQDNRSFPQAAPDLTELRVAQKLARFGEGRRGIPPCQACHGPIAYLKGAPALSTQNGRYVLTQLHHFADRTRTNDINMVMRTIARQLSAEEQDALAQYYGSGAGDSPHGGSLSSSPPIK